MNRHQAHQRYRAVNDADALRRLMKEDLFFLMVHILGRRDMDNDWCFARCREVAASADGHLDLWAREHYKSTIITVGKTIQDILADPEITVGIFSHSRPIAKSFLRQIKREFETNQTLRDLFPHVAPPLGKGNRTWSEDGGITVKRLTNPKEATVEAWGLVDGQPTGKHFSLVIYDDVVTRDSVSTPEQIKKTTEAWELSLNLGAHGGKRRMIGTRYHFNDTYRAVMERGSVLPRIYPATRDGRPDGEPVFLTRASLAEKRRDMGPYTFGCQMLQNPVADSTQGFKAEWLRTWSGPDAQGSGNGPAPHRAMNRYILVDPASEKKKGSDYTVMWVVGLARDGNIYVLDGVRDRLNLTERAEALFRLHRRWQPLGVGYEKYGQQADIEHMEYCMRREAYSFRITPLGGPMPKNDRIRRLVPWFEQGRVLFPFRLLYLDAQGRTRDLTRDFLHDEFTAFPAASHDDMLDCLSRIADQEMRLRFPKPGESPRSGPGSLYGPSGPDRPARAVTQYDPARYGLEERSGL